MLAARPLHPLSRRMLSGVEVYVGPGADEGRPSKGDREQGLQLRERCRLRNKMPSGDKIGRMSLVLRLLVAQSEPLFGLFE
jgi:hypothetical protein